MANSVKADLSGLESLVKGLKDEYSVKIGIIGSNAKQQHDSKSGLTNADIGTFHEFGTKRMPRRSFFEDATIRKVFSPDQMKDMKKILWKQFFVKNVAKKFMQDIGAKALDAVWMAFDTNGFGEWKPLTISTEQNFRKARKRNVKKHGYQILTDTGRLRHSISFKVIKK